MVVLSVTFMPPNCICALCSVPFLLPDPAVGELG
jgi:hypothetical protein